MREEMKTETISLSFAPQYFAFLFLIVMASLFSLNSIAEEATTIPTQGESGLSPHPWQVGFFVQGGYPPSYEIQVGPLHYGVDLQIFSGGLEIGKQTGRLDGYRLLRGRGEAVVEVLPFWFARYPPQTQVLHFSGSPVTYSSRWNGEDFHGTSITPFLLRWNFSQRDSTRIVPWTQLGGGLLWTNHKFPYSFSGGTSVINFTPQVGAGVNIFNQPKHSLNLAMKAVHISNASLGDHNPGLNVTFQFSAGYSWWK